MSDSAEGFNRGYDAAERQFAIHNVELKAKIASLEKEVAEGDSRILELQEHHDTWRTRSQELATILTERDSVISALFAIIEDMKVL